MKLYKITLEYSLGCDGGFFERYAENILHLLSLISNEYRIDQIKKIELLK